MKFNTNSLKQYNKMKKLILNYIKFMFAILLFIIAVAILVIPMLLSHNVLFIILWFIFFGGFLVCLFGHFVED